jgi:hypothetical protein
VTYAQRGLRCTPRNEVGRGVRIMSLLSMGQATATDVFCLYNISNKWEHAVAYMVEELSY